MTKSENGLYYEKCQLLPKISFMFCSQKCWSYDDGHEFMAILCIFLEENTKPRGEEATRAKRSDFPWSTSVNLGNQVGIFYGGSKTNILFIAS